MYDFKLNKNEEIKLISDNTIVYTAKEIRNVTCIVTNQRLIILDYPNGVHNSAEDLRISSKISYIRNKEVIEEIDLKNIKNITKEANYFKMEFRNKKYINLNDDKVIEYLDSIKQ